MHAQGDLVEKCLGKGEHINVAKNNLVAFTDDLKILEPSPDFALPKSEYVRIEGPGSIYIETCIDKPSTWHQTFYKSELNR